MINHIVLIKLADPTVRDHCIEELRRLGDLANVESIAVEPELGEAPNRWDIAVVTQHRDAEQLEEFRVDGFHKQVGGGIAQYVEAMGAVDFASDRITVFAEEPT